MTSPRQGVPPDVTLRRDAADEVSDFVSSESSSGATMLEGVVAF